MAAVVAALRQQLEVAAAAWQRRGNMVTATVAAVWQWRHFTAVALRRRLRLAVVAAWHRWRGGGSFAAAAVQQSKGGDGGSGSLAAGLAAAV